MGNVSDGVGDIFHGVALIIIGFSTYKDFTPSESDGVKSICEENFAVKQQYKGWKKF